MPTMTFDAWVIEDLNMAMEEERNVQWYIFLEEKIKAEHKKTQLRRSERLARKREESQINEAYEIYVKSIEVQSKQSQ